MAEKEANTEDQGFDPSQIPEEAGDWGKGAVDEVRRLRETVNQYEWAKDIDPDVGQKLAAMSGDDEAANRAFIDYGLETGYLETQEPDASYDPDNYEDPSNEDLGLGGEDESGSRVLEEVDGLKESLAKVQAQLADDEIRREAALAFDEAQDKLGVLPDEVDEMMLAQFGEYLDTGASARDAATRAFEKAHGVVKALRESSADEDASQEAGTPAPSPGEGGAVVTTGDKQTIEQIVAKHIG